MTKNQYLEELKKELKAKNIADVNDVIAEYEEHFRFKEEEGLTEEEIAKKLSSPKEIAAEYAEAEANEYKGSKGARGARIAGIVALSVPAVPLYILIFCSVLVLGAFAVAVTALGFCLLTTINIYNLIPSMPYVSAAILAIACFALAVLSIVGTYYLFIYVRQWGKVYLRWCDGIINGNRYPALSLQPAISKKTAFKTKLITVIALIVFIAAFGIGYASLCAAAGSMEPWHVFGWFM